MDCGLNMSARDPTTTRKVVFGDRKVRLGVYDLKGDRVTGPLVSGKEYRAKLNNEYLPVVAGENQLLYPLTNESSQ